MVDSWSYDSYFDAYVYMYIYISIYEYIFKYMYIHGTQPLSQNKIPGSSYVLPTKAFLSRTTSVNHNPATPRFATSRGYGKCCPQNTQGETIDWHMTNLAVTSISWDIECNHSIFGDFSSSLDSFGRISTVVVEWYWLVKVVVILAHPSTS